MNVSLAYDFAPNSTKVKTLCRALKIPQPPTGWLASQKFDGQRAVWDGTRMLMRGGNHVSLPQNWESKLPSLPLDGELVAGTSRQNTGLFRRGRANEAEWMAMGARFHVFDVYDPNNVHGTFEKRQKLYEQAIFTNAALDTGVPNWVVPVQHIVMRNDADAKEFFKKVTGAGGEGIMLRAPKSLYEPERTPTLLKQKTVDVDDFVITHIHTGKGRLQGLPASATVQRVRDGSVTKVSVAGRQLNVGDVVKVKFRGVSNKGVPQNATL